MSLREFVVLGTSSQVPTRHRNHNGYLLRWDGHGFLFDPGEGIQRQFIHANTSVTCVTKIFITHFHGDHCLGLAGIIQRLSLDRVPHPVEVYFPETGERYFHRLVNASIYVKNIKPIPVPVPLSGGVIKREGNLRIEALPLKHAVDTVGYRIIEEDRTRFDPDKLKALGLRGPVVGVLQRAGKVEHEGRIVTLDEVSFQRRGAGFALIMDTRLTDNCFELAKGVDMLVCESTFLKPEEKLARDYMHMTAEQAGIVARDSGARELVLTHFSQRYANIKAFKREARRHFDEVHAVRDLDRLPFARPDEAVPEEPAPHAAQRDTDAVPNTPAEEDS